MRDVEVNFHDAPLRQYEIDPEREREFQRLAHVASALPEKQILCQLLRDGRTATHFIEVISLCDRLADLRQVNSVVAAKTPVLGYNDCKRQCQ